MPEVKKDNIKKTSEVMKPRLQRKLNPAAKKLTKRIIKRENHQIDAEGKVLGRLATEIAMILRGKNKPTFQPHLDEGDMVTVVNVEKIKVTGTKMKNKIYYSHSGYPGGLKETKMVDLFAKDPSEVLRKAVTKMLPNIKLRNAMMKRLKIS